MLCERLFIVLDRKQNWQNLPGCNKVEFQIIYLLVMSLIILQLEHYEKFFQSFS